MVFEDDILDEPDNIQPGSEADIDSDAPDESEGIADISSHEEAAAKARGWVPKNEYRGRAEDWQDAKSFLDRNASLQSEVKELRERFQAQEETYAERLQRIEAANERIIREDRERLQAQLRQAKRQAVELSDVEEFDRLEREETEYYRRQAEYEKTQKPANVQEQAPKLLPETQDWIRRNSWFNESPAMRQIALGFYEEANEGMPATRDESRRLAYVEKKMSEVYPDKFGGGNRSSAVETGSRNVPQKRITQLTGAERAAMNKFIKRGIIKDEAEYIRYLNEYE